MTPFTAQPLICSHPQTISASMK